MSVLNPGGHHQDEGGVERVRTRGSRGVALSLALILLVVSGFVGVVSSAPPDRQKGHNSQLDGGVLGHALDMIRRGRTTFRDDTFGSEDFWGGELRLHEAIAKVPPTTALGVGLKVDAQALPAETVEALSPSGARSTRPGRTSPSPGAPARERDRRA